MKVHFELKLSLICISLNSLLVRKYYSKNSPQEKGWVRSISYEGWGAGGIWEAPFKNRMTPLSLPIFFHMAPPCGGHFFRMTLHFSKNKRKKNPTLPPNFFNILCYFSSLRCCAHHEGNIYNPYTTETCSLKNANQKKEKSISDILVMARPRSVCDIWPVIGIFLI